MPLSSRSCAPLHSRSSQILVFVTTAFLLCAIITFAFVHDRSRAYLSSQFFNLPSGSEKDHDLSIALHPEDHVTRAASTLSYQWNITKDYRWPDGVKKLVYLINNEFPGPTIEARSGDNIVIEVFNSLNGDEGVAFHWHGMYMNGANDMDGAVGITQEAILPGSSFTYTFDISPTQSGTFWYHSHFDLQRADGLYGGLIVHNPLVGGKSEMEQYDYVEEKLLLVGDWYHRPAGVVQGTYVNPDSYGLEPGPDSMVVNGRGSFSCSMAVPARPIECFETSDPTLVFKKEERVRLRVINVGAMTGITLDLSGSSTQAIQLDGGSTLVPGDSSQTFGILYPGERVDLVASWSDESDSEVLSITLDHENFKRRNLALTPTHHYPINFISRKQQNPGQSRLPSTIDFFNLSLAEGRPLPRPLPSEPSQRIIIYTKIELLQKNKNVPMGYLNRTTWKAQSPPLLHLPQSEYDINQLVPFIALETQSPDSDSEPETKYVDIIINNVDEKGHPFHLHGYSFYVLATYKFPRRGVQFYNPFDAKHPAQVDANLVNPVLKDTAYVPGMGYVVLRIRADNPGVWFFHCHILWHSGTGMGMAIEVG